MLNNVVFWDHKPEHVDPVVCLGFVGGETGVPNIVKRCAEQTISPVSVYN